MCAFYEHEVSFDMVATSGAGALPGLLYAAPKNKDPAAALRASIELNIDDLIFDVIPSNFKVFQKQGPFSEMFWEFGRRLPHYDPGSSTSDLASIQRLYNDCLDFVIAAITPTTLNFASKGVCTRITQLLDDIVDWDGLREYPKQYYLNAFNLDTDKLELFDKRTLTHNSFFAALAMPWLFESRTVDGHRYTEGASHDPTSLEAVWDARGLNAEHFDEIVIVESITSEMWNDPRGLYDSLRLTIMDPVVSLAEQVLAAYGAFEYKWNAYIERLYRKKGKEVPRSERMPKLYVVPCDVSEPQSPNILEWSRSNGELLWWIGYERAEEFCKHFLPLSNSSRREARLKEYRYFYRLENGRIESRQKWARIKPFLELFDPIFDRLK
jgi:NTE family protein